YAWASYLAILALPFAIFGCLRLLDFPPLTAAAAVLLAPLIAGPGVGQLGMELRSWLRFGVFPQSVATSLLLVTLGLAWRAVRTGRRLVLTGAMLGLTMLAHLVYGWMGALSICLMALLPDAGVPRRPRILRTLQVGLVSAALCAFQLLPIFSDGYLINRSRVEQVEKYDSHGAAKVLGWLFSGRILDNDRIPALSLLALAGAALLLWRYRATRKIAPSYRFVLAGAVFWILVFFGRPTWGILLVLLGVTPDLQLHRVIAGVQIFLLFLAAMALAELWRQAARRWHPIVAIVATAILLAPAVVERANYLASWKENLNRDVAGIAAEGKDLDAAIAVLKQRGGRAYAGLQSGWGPQFYVGGTPVAAFLSTAQVPAVSFPFNASALPTDIMLRFDERDPAHYRLFNVRSLLVPAGGSPPDFLKPEASMGRFQVWSAPGSGYFDVVDVTDAKPTTRETFYDISDAWLHGDGFAKARYIRLDFHGEPATGLPPAGSDPPGRVLSERQYEASVEVRRPAFVLFRMTWHPNWKVLVDGQPVKTAMLTPGFLGVPVTAGKHEIVCRYEPGGEKILMAVAGLAIVLLLGIAEWKRGQPA
ncbi:MAG TPA: YfhO family protein, partial [Candidatus Solibacter sp.]